MLAYGFLTLERMRLQQQQHEREAGRLATAIPAHKKKAPRPERRTGRAAVNLTGGAPRPATAVNAGPAPPLPPFSRACPTVILRRNTMTWHESTNLETGANAG